MTEIMIEAAELAAWLDEMTVFDCRFSLNDPAAGLQAYRRRHIPEALHLHMEKDLAGRKTGNNGRHPLPERADFEATLRSAGMDTDSCVVLYDDNRLAGAARAWWLLKYFGHHDVRIVSGGFQAWADAGFATESGNPVPRTPGTVSLSAGDSALVVARDAVASRGSAAIVDSREPERFAGRAEPIDPVAGRIPDAVNLPWQGVTDESGRTLAPDVQRQRWQSCTDDENPIVYCGSGVTACVNLLARELAGLPGGRLYAGSWSEWCAHDESAIERD